MKPIADMTVEELGALVCETLRKEGITVTLSGGSCVTIWSDAAFVSKDLDFIEEGPVPRRQVRKALGALGFEERNRYFEHPDTEFGIEFPTGPLMVGDERVEDFSERKTAVGTLRLLTPTDCVKDRLAAWFYHDDLQTLEQAVALASSQAVDLDDIRRWATAENMPTKFAAFIERLATNQKV